MELKISRKKRGYDVKHEAFDEFCFDKFSNLTADQRRQLPYDISLKLGKLNKGSQWLEKISFAERLYILWNAFKEPFYILVRTSQKPITKQDFDRLQVLKENDDLSIGAAKWVLSTFGFVLSHDDLIETMIYGSKVTRSPATKYLVKTKNADHDRVSQMEQHKDNLSFICTVLANYEHMRARISTDYGLSLAEVLVLFFLYDGKEKNIKDCVAYFQNTPNCRRMMIIKAFVSLRDKSYVEKIGNGRRRTTQKITIAGTQLLNKIFIQYILNF